MRELLALISDTDITEVKIERGDNKLLIRRGTPPNQAAQLFTMPQLAPQAPAQPQFAPPQPASDQTEIGDPMPVGELIIAPMVGTFYTAPTPKDTAYVEEGDVIQVGDRVGIIEAMKMMNELTSDFAGRVVKILVKNGQPVEYGQPLMVIGPA